MVGMNSLFKLNISKVESSSKNVFKDILPVTLGVPGSDRPEIHADFTTHTFNGAAQRRGERVRGGVIMRGLTRCSRASREIRTL